MTDSKYALFQGSTDELEKIIASKDIALASKDVVIGRLRSIITRLSRLAYDHKSEKLNVKVQRLLDEAEANAEQFEASDAAPVGDTFAPGEDGDTDIHDKKDEAAKGKPGRKPLDAKLERNTISHDLSEEQKQCDCGYPLSRMTTDETEKARYIPARIVVEKHISHSYICLHCNGKKRADGKKVIRATKPADILPGSIATPSLLAWSLGSKYCDHLPYYRQETMFQRLGLRLSRATMCNWQIELYNQNLRLWEFHADALLDCPLLCVDETPVQVLRNAHEDPKRKSYMWVIVGIRDNTRIINFHFTPDRSAEWLKTFLANYSGVVMTDGWESYRKNLKGLPLRHVGCWVHARRKFVDAKKTLGDAGNTSFAHEMLVLIARLYRANKEIRTDKNATAEDILIQRKRLLRPIIKKIRLKKKEGLRTIEKSSPTYLALQYLRNQWNKLTHFQSLAVAPLDNNWAENAIRPFVIGRKNWLFFNTPNGVNSGTAFYAMIETAKANGLEPVAFLEGLFEKIPLCTTNEEFKALLPWIAQAKAKVAADTHDRKN